HGRSSKTTMKLTRPGHLYLTLPLVLGCALLGRPGLAAAQDAAGMEKLEKENEELKARLDAFEELAKKEGIMPSGAPAPKYVKVLSDMTISGFVQASYFHDFSDPPGGVSPGSLWVNRNDNFTLNKVKITLASPPAEHSGTEWTAG